MHHRTWLAQHAAQLNGKRIAVTGSTGGLGRALCRYLVMLGASLILLDRDEARSEQHRQALCAMRADADVRCIRLDLEDTGSVFAAARALCAQQVDVFLHNAGAYAIPRGRTQVGLDNVFQINFAAPYYIIRKLMPSLRQRGGRVVVVGSIAHNYSKSDPADIDFSTRRAASKVYGNAKRYLMFSLFSLFESEPDVKLSVTHPGICFTGITAHYPKPIFALIKHPMKWIFPSPEKAALPILAGVLEEIPNGAWCGPAVFDIWGRPRVRVLHTCTQKERAAIARSAEEVFARFLREEAAKN